METYQKIETIFERDLSGTKKLIPGKYISKEVEFLKDNQWVYTEKIDGTNIRVHWDGFKIEFEGRTDNASIPKKLLIKLNELFGGEVNAQIFEQKFGSTDVILFGEGYGQGINKAGRMYGNEPTFILFDVLIGREERLWLERPNIEDIAKTFGIDVVPIIGVGTLQNAVDLILAKPNSTIGEAKMEGLVCKPQIEMKDRRGKRIVVKIKVKDFDI